MDINMVGTQGKRIFWLGMHKVLKPTELKRLRQMGFEVFNPAYISPVYDQSADLTVDLDQPTSLPADVFRRLIEYDFFYRPIEPYIAELLNEYFDSAIVTINSAWLKSFSEAYRGPIVYRTYGQHFSLSQAMVNEGMWEGLVCRPNFTIVPFAAESVETEQRWFLDMCSEPVPYQIPDDVFVSPRWDFDEVRPEVAVSLPNIQNPYFADAYASFSAQYPESYFRLYGPQRATPADARIVGRLPRDEFLESLRRSSGYYYDYKDNVAYLPPIEMMQMGGPVVCAEGSLLSRFLGKNSPNVGADPSHVREKLNRLVNGDRVFSEELIASQEETRKRYDRDVVGPVFDRVMGGLLSGPDAKPAQAQIEGPVIRAVSATQRKQKIAIALHADGLFEHNQGRPYAYEGIPRVVDTIVKTATVGSDASCFVSCTRNSVHIVYDFFIDQIRSGAVTLYVVDMVKGRDSAASMLARLAWVAHIDADADVSTAMAPHYYLFPELLTTSKRLALYLPDYFPHLAPNEIFDETEEKDARNKAVGIALAEKAESILTNSSFTKAYLPDAGFTERGDDAKVVVAPLPFLGVDRALDLTPEEKALILKRLSGRPFLFYPTANRPNKKLAFLFRVFAELKLSHPSLDLVLTCDLNHYPAAGAAVEQYELHDSVHLFHRASEGLLRWLYRHTAALSLTSNLEGNFPPQVLEALNYGAPVVATRLPTIVEILGEKADDLLLCGANDAKGFLAALDTAISQREEILARQDSIVAYLKKWNSPEAFSEKVQLVFPEIAANGAAI